MSRGLQPQLERLRGGSPLIERDRHVVTVRHGLDFAETTDSVAGCPSDSRQLDLTGCDLLFIRLRDQAHQDALLHRNSDEGGRLNGYTELSSCVSRASRDFSGETQA